MNYKTSLIPLDAAFPFKIFRGSGFSAACHENNDSYMHRHIKGWRNAGHKPRAL